MNDSDRSRMLRVSLRANAVFSTLSGLAFTFASGAIAAFLGEIASMEVLIVGVQLLLFAGALVWLASRPVIPIPLAIAVIVADLLWVLGTVVVVYIDLFSRGGTIAALVVANIVLILAVAQSIGVRQARAPKQLASP